VSRGDDLHSYRGRDCRSGREVLTKLVSFRLSPAIQCLR
jgi:hypothetical protein